MSVAEHDMRVAQYNTHCTPGQDAMGNPCPVPICIVPPDVTCNGGTCEMVP